MPATLSRPSSPLLLLLGCSLVSGLVSTPAPALAQEEEPPPPLFVERVDVSVVNVEVFVTDENGYAVAGLEKNDFDLYVDGEPVEITNFYSARRRDRVLGFLEEEAPAAAPEPEAERSEALPEEQQLHLVIYIDHFNLTARSRNQVLEELAGFLEDRAAQRDRISLVAYDRSLEVVQPFTRDRFLIADGLRRMTKAPTYRQVDDAQRRRIMRLINTEAAEGDLASAYQSIRSYVQVVQADLRHSAAALQKVVQSLAGLPGRKAVLYVSEGLPQRPGFELYQQLVDAFGIPALRELAAEERLIDPSVEALQSEESSLYGAVVRHANAHQVTLYTLDAGDRSFGGVSAEHTDLTASPAGHLVLDQLRQANLQEPLIDLADRTGGTAVLNTRNFDGALRALAKDFDSFYSLGFRARGGDGLRHAIEVKVKRPGFTVRHRTGYVDKPEAERVADRTLSSLVHEVEKNPLGVSLDFGRPKKSGRHRYELPILVRVPVREVTFLPHEGNREGRLRIYVQVQDEEGGISDVHEQLYPLSVSADALAQAREREIGYAAQLEVLEGTPKVAVGVWDEISGVESFILKRVLVGPDDRRRRR